MRQQTLATKPAIGSEAEPTPPREARASARPLRIGLFGGFGIGNFGNDASLEAVLSYLRAQRPDTVLTCICTDPHEVTARYGVEAIPTVFKPKGIWRYADTLLLRQPSTWTNWIRCLGDIRRFDVLLIAGTGVFDDFRDTPLGWPSRLLRWSLAARLNGVRVSYLSVGAGPILSPISRFLMKRAAQLGQHRSYRDAESKQYMQGIGVNEDASAVVPDLAFLLPAPPLAPRAANAPLTVGVGIMNYRGWRASDAVHQSYVETQIRFIQWLEAQGHAVRILIGQTPTDLVTVREIEARLGRSLISDEDAAMHSFHDAMRAAAKTDIVIASRYHTQIAALKLGLPLISLSYAPKNDALLEAAGLGGFSQDIHHIDFDLLVKHFQTLAADRERYAGVVKARVSAMEDRLRAALNDMDVLGA